MYKQLSLLACLVCSGHAFAQVDAATHYAINYEGRSVKDYASGTVEFNFPGSALKTKFTGTQISINLKGKGDHFDVLINGKLSQKIITNYGNEAQNFPLFSSDEKQTVEIEVVKRTENYDNMTEVVSLDHDGYLEGIWGNKPHILFIGDSISAGFGSESSKRQCTWDEVYNSSNARLAFPHQTADILDTTVTQVSLSGLGLIRNWDGNQPHHNLTYYTDKAGAIFGVNKYFEDRYPDLIVVEVGTNDFSTDPKSHEPWADIEEVKTAWTERMVEYTEQLKHRYNDANIVYMPRPAYPYDYIIPATQDAIKQLNAKGVDGLYSHTFISPLEGCIWHPTAAEHKDIATKLSTFIETNDLL